MIFSLFSLGSLLFAAEHYARVEPWDRVTLKAAAPGQVLEAKLSLEGRSVRDARVIHLDDRLDRLDLDNSRETLKLLRQNLDLTQKMLPGLEGSFRRQQGYFQRLSRLSTASQTQKDQAYQAMVAAQNQWLNTRQQLLNLRQNILKTQQKIATLEDRIAKKNIRLKNRYLYRLMVRPGEYAGIGTPLAIVDDLSRAKAVIYLSEDEVKALPKLHLWIDGKRSDLKPYKIWKETDEKYLSSYRAEIELPVGRYPFSSLVKMELK
jgi:multidrug efflux pump subunit AcrA (membrane-fusion protein)